jgi:hypothetical protein
MILKTAKIGVITVVGLGLIGGLVFGTDVFSYVSSSARSVKTAMKDAVPIEFELKRARDLLEDIIPEMQANIRLIAQEEVEVAALKGDIVRCEQATSQQNVRVSKLREALDSDRTRFTFAGMTYTRRQVKEDLARQFDRLKEAELVLAGKKRLLDTREKSLQAAMQIVERTRSQKAQLEDQIEALAAQHRLVKAAAVGSKFKVDHSKLAQTEKLIRQIKKRLDVAERVLAHEARFVEPIQVDVISETDLIAEVDEHLSGTSEPQVAQGDTLALRGSGQVR